MDLYTCFTFIRSSCLVPKMPTLNSSVLEGLAIVANLLVGTASLRLELSIVCLEELGHLHGVAIRDLVECHRTDVVRLSRAHERIVLEEVLFLRLVYLCIRVEELFGLRGRDVLEFEI